MRSWERLQGDAGRNNDQQYVVRPCGASAIFGGSEEVRVRWKGVPARGGGVVGEIRCSVATRQCVVGGKARAGNWKKRGLQRRDLGSAGIRRSFRRRRRLVLVICWRRGCGLRFADERYVSMTKPG